MNESGKTDLVILAAGMGSRYKGLKQLDGFGPNQETIMEYSIFDAIKAGFDRIILVVRREFEEECTNQVLAKFEGQVEFCFVCQELNDLPEGYHLPSDRAKPWGTGHAVLAARKAVQNPFAVINADDFYGFEAFSILHRFLAKVDPRSPHFAMVAYFLGNTLSDHGTVNRGVIKTKEGKLNSIRERGKIRREQGKMKFEGPTGTIPLPENSLVSMNFWGFTPLVMDLFERDFKKFLDSHVNDPTAEFFLGDPIDRAICNREVEVEVLRTQEPWIGVTYPNDKEEAARKIQERVFRGDYPNQLGRC